MAVVRYNYRVDRFEAAVLVELEGLVEDEVKGYGIRIKESIQGLIRERAAESSEGGLADSVRGTIVQEDDDTWNAIVFSDEEHALWFEEGTGVHGPRQQPILPRGKYMMFTPRGLSSRVIAYKVQGQPAQHPFRDGLAKVVGQGGSLRRALDDFD